MLALASHVLSLLLATNLAGMVWAHPVAMDRGVSQKHVLGSQWAGCVTKACSKSVEVFGLITSPPRPGPSQRAWLPPSAAFDSVLVVSIPSVGRSPPSGYA
jgi:hypothetical protein